jgi:hypothetical protein
MGISVKTDRSRTGAFVVKNKEWLRQGKLRSCGKSGTRGGTTGDWLSGDDS